MTLFHLSERYLLGLLLWLLAGGACLILLLKLRQHWKQKPSRLTLVHAGLSSWFFLALLTLGELYFAIWFDRTDSFNMTNVSRIWFQRHIVLHGR